MNNLNQSNSQFVFSFAKSLVAAGATGLRHQDLQGMIRNNLSLVLGVWQALVKHAPNRGDLIQPIQNVLSNAGILNSQSAPQLARNDIGDFRLYAPPPPAPDFTQPASDYAPPPPPPPPPSPLYVAPPVRRAPSPLVVAPPPARPAKAALTVLQLAQQTILPTRDGLGIPGNPAWQSFIDAQVTAMTSGHPDKSLFRQWAALYAQSRQKNPTLDSSLAGQLFAAVHDGLLSAGVPLSQVDAGMNMVRQQAAILFGNGAARMSGESNPQALVDMADNHFRQKAASLAQSILASDPRALTRLTQVRKGAQAGSWPDRQIMAYLREKLIEAGAPALMVSQATMHGEGDLEKTVEDVIRRAQQGDQNAMAMLVQVRKMALSGNPQAKQAFDHAMQVTSMHGDSTTDADMGAAARRGAARKPAPKTPPKAAKPTKQAARIFKVVSQPAAQRSNAIQGARVTSSTQRPTRGSRPAGQGQGGGSSDGSGDSSGADQGSQYDNSGDSSGDGQFSGTKTPIDRLIKAAQAGNDSAVKEIARIRKAEDAGDQRAMGLMQAIRGKTSHTQKGKQARAVGMSHGKPLTRARVAAIAGDFGAEYGNAGAQFFWRGVANPNTPIPSNASPEIANILSTGQCVGMARNLQAARVPGGSLSAVNAMMGWENGEGGEYEP